MATLPKIAPGLQPPDTLDLPTAMAAIAQDQTNQTQGVQQFGQAQDQNIQNIYNTLGGDLTKNTQAIQSIYGNAGGNVAAAYDRAGTGGQAAAAQNQGAIGNFATSIGMDPRAVGEVTGRLAQQAQTFDLRNRQSSASRQANLAQLGAGMTAVARLAQQTADQAKAQGRTDLARKLATEVSRINASASQQKAGFTAVKANQAAKAAAQAQTAILQAQKQLMSEQRADARAAASDARAASRASASGPDWYTKFAMQNAEADRRAQNAADAKINPQTIAQDAYMQQVQKQLGRGSNGMAAVDSVLSGKMTLAQAKSQFTTPAGKKLNWGLLTDIINKAP
jgi:hypothetical protein